MPNMVVPGSDSAEVATPQDMAAATIDGLGAVVPGAHRGITFLSGGQPPSRATANLAAIRRQPAPWPVTFSFGRELADGALPPGVATQPRLVAVQRVLAQQVAASSVALTMVPGSMLLGVQLEGGTITPSLMAGTSRVRGGRRGGS
jgi:fructose-bisphosphate aldolase class I